MAVQTTVHVVTPEAWTPLNAGSAAAGNIMIMHKHGAPVRILISTSSSAPTYDQTTRDQAFRLEPGEELPLGSTCALLAPGLGSPQYMYAAPAEGSAASLYVSAA